MRELPSAYVRRQCWISADPDERALPAVIDYVGADRFVWATDYPHSDHGADYMARAARAAGRACLEPTAAAISRGENAARLYQLV